MTQGHKETGRHPVSHPKYLVETFPIITQSKRKVSLSHTHTPTKVVLVTGDSDVWGTEEKICL